MLRGRQRCVYDGCNAMVVMHVVWVCCTAYVNTTFLYMQQQYDARSHQHKTTPAKIHTLQVDVAMTSDGHLVSVHTRELHALMQQPKDTSQLTWYVSYSPAHNKEGTHVPHHHYVTCCFPILWYLSDIHTGLTYKPSSTLMVSEYRSYQTSLLQYPTMSTWWCWMSSCPTMPTHMPSNV